MHLKAVMTHFHQPGKVDWIGIRPTKRAPLQPLQSVDVEVKSGLKGDHYSGQNRKRQITLIQAEHLISIAQFLGKTEVSPFDTRRNIVVSGINLMALRDKQVQIGSDVILEITGICHPCTRMEENLGNGGYNAMRGIGGLTAKVIQSGCIHINDSIQIL